MRGEESGGGGSQRRERVSRGFVWKGGTEVEEVKDFAFEKAALAVEKGWGEVRVGKKSFPLC